MINYYEKSIDIFINGYFKHSFLRHHARVLDADTTTILFGKEKWTDEANKKHSLLLQLHSFEMFDENLSEKQILAITKHRFCHSKFKDKIVYRKKKAMIMIILIFCFQRLEKMKNLMSL